MKGCVRKTLQIGLELVASPRRKGKVQFFFTGTFHKPAEHERREISRIQVLRTLILNPDTGTFILNNSRNGCVATRYSIMT
jgi:hypothetical protein